MKALLQQSLAAFPKDLTKGYGKHLMRLVEDLAIQRNLRQVELDYWVSNIRAAGFYESCGFEKQRMVVFKEIK